MADPGILQKKGEARDNVSAPSSFIANAHDELVTEKDGLLKQIRREGICPHRPSALNPPLETALRLDIKNSTAPRYHIASTRRSVTDEEEQNVYSFYSDGRRTSNEIRDSLHIMLRLCTSLSHTHTQTMHKHRQT